MKYLLLIAFDESVEVPDEELERRTAAFATLSGELAAEGVLAGGDRLHPSSTATTVRVTDGDVIIADGPFAETKEQIVGYYVVDCPDLDAATAIAARIPSATIGSVEVRPIWGM